MSSAPGVLTCGLADRRIEHQKRHTKQGQTGLHIHTHLSIILDPLPPSPPLDVRTAILWESGWLEGFGGRGLDP